jgi:hypothetical protein
VDDAPLRFARQRQFPSYDRLVPKGYAKVLDAFYVACGRTALKRHIQDVMRRKVGTFAGDEYEQLALEGFERTPVMIAFEDEEGVLATRSGPLLVQEAVIRQDIRNRGASACEAFASAAFAAVDASLELASRNLGASPWTSFRAVTFPLATPGLIASAIFVFLESLFTGTYFVGVPDVTTLPLLMFDATMGGNYQILSIPRCCC